ncbi:MAG: hypothetical protein GY754_13840 [bacterium]|nr:hypothetical protein [bacterium]
MKKGFFNVYQFVVPVVFFPLAYYLWYMRLEGQHELVILIMSIPVLTSYFVPALGTNYFKLWQFNTKVIVGKFRPHHGFVFGTGMSMLGLLCVAGPGQSEFSVYQVIRTGLMTGSFMAFWNWLYDAYAIETGFMTVFNRKYAEGASAADIAMDYAPVYFGFFGFFYGMEIKLIEHYLLSLQQGDLFWWFLVLCNLVTFFVPVSIYMIGYYIKHGELGVYPHHKEGVEE